MEFIVNFQPVGRRLVCSKPLTIFEAANRVGLELKSVCGGNGNCGKCRVKVTGDYLSPISNEERERLSPDEIRDGYRQACRTFVDGPVFVYVPASSFTEKQKLQLSGGEIRVPPLPSIRKVFICPSPASLDDVRADLKRVSDELHSVEKSSPLKAGLPVLAALSEALRVGDWTVTLTLEDQEIIWAEPGDTTGQLLGLAVDLGTTKIAAYLIDLLTGETLGAQGVMNPQIAYGEDVMSRIHAALVEYKTAARLQADVVDAINQVASKLLEDQGATPQAIMSISLVGNTAMHHMFLGLPLKQLATAPFIPSVASSVRVRAAELGLATAPGAFVHLLPPIAGFVGSDHTAALLASNFHCANRNLLLLDIGTNTEIAVQAGKQIITCSCASGPAFEGAHIKHGMRAAPGAIERLRIDPVTLKVHLETIDDQAPVGICGSGILDTLAELKRVGIIKNNGHIQPELPGVKSSDGHSLAFILAHQKGKDGNQIIEITQEDIVELQLAIGAVRAGVEVLLGEARISFRDLDQVIFAGAFGTYIDPLSAIQVGLIPPVPLENIKQVGNAAGTGARQVLINQESWESGVSLAKKARYVELTTHPAFRKHFVKAMHF